MSFDKFFKLSSSTIKGYLFRQYLNLQITYKFSNLVLTHILNSIPNLYSQLYMGDPSVYDDLPTSVRTNKHQSISVLIQQPIKEIMLESISSLHAAKIQ